LDDAGRVVGEGYPDGGLVLVGAVEALEVKGGVELFAYGVGGVEQDAGGVGEFV
jgi:hypothetical protein